MSYSDLQKIVTDLDSQEFDPEDRDRDGSLVAVLNEIIFHAAYRFWQFTPTHVGAARFEERLTAWIRNPELMERDVATMLRLVPQIQFVDRDDMLTLYRAAFNGPIKRWLLDELGLDFSVEDDEFYARLRDGLETTWFCPVTDSMNISQFHHVNGIEGKNQRPSWRTLRSYGDVGKIRAYMQTNNLKRLVLLEDFVGTGMQSGPVLRFAIKNFCHHISVLFVPLVISEIGETNIRNVAGMTPGFTFEYAFKVPLHVHVQEEPQADETPFMTTLRSLVQRSFEKVRLPSTPGAKPLDHAFGFGSAGTLLVIYSNCPNNTLPLIWHNSPQWKALFPRVSRY
jgi:hypothetical protein